MEERKLSQEQTKEYLLNILMTFDKFCSTHGLTYFIAYGTLLGAVRHGGFIPWDDDIDVVMPRRDYDKFIKIVSEKPLSENMVIKSEANNNTDYPFTKIEDIRTRIYNSKSTLHSSLWIDVFPLDEIDPSYKFLKINDKLVRFFGLLIEQSCVESITENNIIKKQFRRILCSVSKLPPKHFWLKCVNFVINLNKKNSNYLANIVWGYGLKEIMDKSIYFPIKQISFEGVMFNAPNNVNLYLSTIYGDYMTLPPEEKRVNHKIQVSIKE